MRHLTAVAALLVASIPSFAPAQSRGRAGAPASSRTEPAAPERAIRRDIPITNSIRRAYEKGTRDSTGKPGRNYWQLRTDYTIQARLDPTTQTITGSETITLHNESPDPLTEIQLRLDHNIFRPTVPRGMSTPAETTEGMVITKLAVNGTAVDLNAPPPGRGGRGGQQPPGLRATGLGSTLARVTLATPIAPKSTASLNIDWRTKLPGGPGGSGHRMTQRWADTLFQPTQWFPRVAKYDDLRGWDGQLYLGPSEFYNNFGRFDVRITVPGGWIVSGTGLLQNPNEVLTATARARLSKVLGSDSITTIVGESEVGPGVATAAGDWLTWHLVADQVNDFAWATAKKFVWTATRATIPTKGPVPIHMVYLPGRANLFSDAGQISRHALEFYSKLWAPYPFPQLTLQDGPSAGMEYPMVINSNSGAADHEAGHQWWPMMVGNNETWYGWMDEGFNQYMNILSEADYAGQKPVLDGEGQKYGRVSGDELEAPLMWNANWAGPQYGYQTYLKTPLMLSMLGGIVGDSAVQKAHSAYTHAWAFKHPSPWDYMFFMSNQFQQDLGWFWYYWLFTTERVDGRIHLVTTAGTKTTVTIRQEGQMPSPVVLRVEFEPTGAPIRLQPNAKAEGPNAAIVTWPASVWFNGSKTFVAGLDFGGRPIRKITLDPFGRFPDKDPADNVWPR
jgi:hypothetical protein